MPAKDQDNMKGTSPSPAIERGIDQAWGAQNTQSSTTAQEAIGKQWNKLQIPTGGTPGKK